jgi:hypothetical protein
MALQGTAPAQSAPEVPLYTRLNTFGMFTAYSNDSSHIFLGLSERRKLLEFGVSYSRRLLLRRNLNLQYHAELLPIALESDPLGRLVIHQTSPTVQTFVAVAGAPVTCGPVTQPYSLTTPNGTAIEGTETVSCSGRQWTVGESMSPLGFELNLRPRRTTQPFVVAHGGYMYSTRSIPISSAGSFNFTADIGAGIEVYRSHSQSIRTEFRIHHISNAGTADYNPGIDNGLFQLTYTFGR